MPHTFPKRIFLGLCGLSPQVVTEALYALMVQQEVPFVPTHVHLVTTKEGAERIRLSLLDPQTGKIAALCNEYQLPYPEFNEKNIHIIADETGCPLDDIGNNRENSVTANFISTLILQLTSDENSALHVSIAGGRKTMSFYLGYTLTLFARPQDRLSHVLVSDGLESNPEFFYPSKQPKMLYNRYNQIVSTAAIDVRLADMPFLRLRNTLPAHQLKTAHPWAELIDIFQNAITPDLLHPSIEIDLAHSKIHQTLKCGNKFIKLAPLNLAFYIWFSYLRQQEIQGIRYNDLYNPQHFNSLLNFYAITAQNTERLDDLKRRLNHTPTADQKTNDAARLLEENVSRINHALKKNFGLNATPYLITKTGKKGYSRYTLSLNSPFKINIISPSTSLPSPL